MIVYGYSLTKNTQPKNKVYLIKRMAAAAGSNTPGASSGATTSSIGSNSVKPLRYVRTLHRRTELTTPITTINVHVYKIGEDIRKTIDEFIDHLFAVVNTNTTPPETTVYTQPDFIAFLNLQPVVPISQSSLPIDDVATAVAIASAITHDISTPITVKVGKYNKYYPGYHKATAADWMNPAFQAALVQAHQQGGGWPLLETPLQYDSGLLVLEGQAMINDNYVVDISWDNTSLNYTLQNGFFPMNPISKIPWTTTPPTLNDKWTVNTSSVPPAEGTLCLFVKDDVPAAAATTPTVETAPPL